MRACHVCVRLEAHHRHKNNMPTLSGRIWATLPHSAWRPPPPLLCARASATSTSHHRTPWPVRHQREGQCGIRLNPRGGASPLRRLSSLLVAPDPLLPLFSLLSSLPLSVCLKNALILSSLSSRLVFSLSFTLYLSHHPSPNLQMTPSLPQPPTRLTLPLSFSHTISLSFPVSVFLLDRSEGHKLLSFRPQESSKPPLPENNAVNLPTHTHTRFVNPSRER